jgi:dienelactone hydrolase
MMTRPLLLAMLTLLAASTAVRAAVPADVRLQPLKDLNGYFPFIPPKSKAEWEARAAFVRRQILVSQGLWPMPTKTPLNAVIHGKIDKPEYTVEKVYFESAPGFYVTGNLYRPKNVKGKVPGVLFAHGHWQDARLSTETEANLLREIATGQERFEQGGRSRFQSMCVQLARMGCVVWQWDMLSDSDAIQLSRSLVHGFAKQRPEMNTTENWGLYSPQAETHLQSIMGLQTWNAIRSMDFLLSLPEVDPERTAVTGASGGGTQTMLLSAVDPRVKLSFPAVMVSTAMQGGCTCENASLLRIGTGNVEFAGLFAPGPLGMTTADDWTKEMATKGFPELKQLYTLLGAPDNVMLHRGEHFPHNYNAVSRSGFYGWLNRHFKLGFKEPIVERDYEPLTREQLTVWDDKHPAPKAGDPDFERRLVGWWTDDANRQLHSAEKSPEGIRKAIGDAVEVVIGRTAATTGDVEGGFPTVVRESADDGGYTVRSGSAHNKTYGEELPIVGLFPKQANGKVVLWLDDAGKSGISGADGNLKPAVRQLLKAGATVVAADLLFQGDFLADGQPVKQTRTVNNGREAAAYTFGYNRTLFAQRAHDVLTLVKLCHTKGMVPQGEPTDVAVVGFGGVGPIVAAARAVAGDRIGRVAVDTGGFRFGKLTDYRDPEFLPGGAKYLDLPGFLALGAPQPLWLAGEGKRPELVAEVYKSAGKEKQLTAFTGEASQREAAAAKWLTQ